MRAAIAKHPGVHAGQPRSAEAFVKAEHPVKNLAIRERGVGRSVETVEQRAVVPRQAVVVGLVFNPEVVVLGPVVVAVPGLHLDAQLVVTWRATTIVYALFHAIRVRYKEDAGKHLRSARPVDVAIRHGLTAVFCRHVT